MDVQKVLRMNGGAGEMSYAQNSMIQRAIVSASRAARHEAAAILCSRALPKCMNIADLGCSSGPNALLVISDIVEAVEQRCLKLGRHPPEFQLLLNDLPCNDFNNIFSSVPDFLRRREQDDGGRRRRGHCFVSGVPGSFYGRLFASNSLHFVNSSSSLHWLSKVPLELQGGGATVAGGRPLNKGKLYISETSPPLVSEAYLKQFRGDFLYFLKCRAEEMVQGGHMVLTLMGRRGSDPPSLPKYTFHWELLAKVLMDLASEGMIEEEKVDSFAAPYYTPSEEELKHLVEEEGSFSIRSLDAFQTSWDNMDVDEAEVCGGGGANRFSGGRRSRRSIAELKAKTVRAVVESMLQAHFGEGVIDELFERYVLALEDHFAIYRPEVTSVVLTVAKK